MSKSAHDYPGEIQFYMVSVEAPRNARNIDAHNAEIVDSFNRMAQRVGFSPADHHIHAEKGVPLLYVAGSEALVDMLQKTQGKRIKSVKRCIRQGSTFFFRGPWSRMIVPEYPN